MQGEKKERKKEKEQKVPKESGAIQSHAISGSIGRLGENNEVNGSAAPTPLLLLLQRRRTPQTCETRTEQRDNARTDCVDDDRKSWMR